MLRKGVELYDFVEEEEKKIAFVTYRLPGVELILLVTSEVAGNPLAKTIAKNLL